MAFRALLVLLLAGTFVGGCATAGGAPTAAHGVVVTGIGRVSVRPDVATIDVGAEARAPQLADATADVDKRIREVLARVKALGVPDADVRTAFYSISPITEQPQRPMDTTGRIIGYRVSNVVHVRTRDVAGVGRIVDAAVAGGANVVGNVQFGVDDSARPEAEARALAMKNAAERARQITAAGGVKLGRLLSVKEAATYQPMAVRMTLSAARAPGPVEPGELDVTITLEAHYAIEP